MATKARYPGYKSLGYQFSYSLLFSLSRLHSRQIDIYFCLHVFVCVNMCFICACLCVRVCWKAVHIHSFITHAPASIQCYHTLSILYNIDSSSFPTLMKRNMQLGTDESPQSQAHLETQKASG